MATKYGFRLIQVDWSSIHATLSFPPCLWCTAWCRGHPEWISLRLRRLAHHKSVSRRWTPISLLTTWPNFWSMRSAALRAMDFLFDPLCLGPFSANHCSLTFRTSNPLVLLPVVVDICLGTTNQIKHIKINLAGQTRWLAPCAAHHRISNFCDCYRHSCPFTTTTITAAATTTTMTTTTTTTTTTFVECRSIPSWYALKFILRFGLPLVLKYLSE